MAGRKRNQKRKEERKMLEKLKEMIAVNLGVDADKITADTSFEEDLEADSLDLLELVMAAEDEFCVEIPAEDVAGFKTVGDVIKYIKSKQE